MNDWRSEAWADYEWAANDFPVVAYEAVHAVVRKRSHTNPDMYEQWSGAWNAVSYRFLAVTQYSESFTKSVADGSGTSSVEGRYGQERDLFGFFGNAVSALEAAFYGLYAIGSLLAPAQFRLKTGDDRRKVGPAATKAAFARAFPDDPISDAMESVINDVAYGQLHEIRNVLTHRAAPGRTVFLQVGMVSGPPTPDEWKVAGIKLDIGMTSERRSELARLLTAVFEASQSFVEARLS